MNDINSITETLYKYAKDRDFSGWDPFDGLNSRIFKATPLNKIPVCRLAWIQFFKRCPVNFRPLAMVPKGRNPKGIALFASAGINLYKSTGNKQYLQDARELLSWLDANYTTGYSGKAWGYNFPWQSRLDFKPLLFPTIVTTSFIALSFLDGYDATGDKTFLETAVSASKFILNDLNVYQEGASICYSYGPDDHERVYNATALGGQLLARLYKATNDKNYLQAATNALDFVAARQQKDGSWFYGDDPTQQWIDNFHTGYNLIALKKYQEYTQDKKYENSIIKGFEFYKNGLFTKQGLPKYFAHSYYPVDIHAWAFSIITFMEFGMYERANELAQETIKLLWNKKGYFDYQITKFFKTSIPYMRWSESWILLALSKNPVKSSPI